MYTQQDYKSDQPLKFCAGCGDHGVAAAMQRAMAELGVPPH